MDKLEKIANAVFIVFAILVIYIFYYYYTKEDLSSEIDTDGDGIVTRAELKAYIKKELERHAENPPQFRGVVKSAISGAVRGACTGLLLSGVEGAITSAIVLGMINPIITGIEHTYY